MKARSLAGLACVLLVVACAKDREQPDSGGSPVDTGTSVDTGVAVDTGEVVDTGPAADTGVIDTGPADTGPADTGAEEDAGYEDAEVDAGSLPFEFSTPAWMSGERVPTEFTCDGPGGWPHQNNPELIWDNPPAGTLAFVMIFDDPDAGDFPHWAFFTADATLSGIPASTSNTANLPTGVTELMSGDGRTGYVPNCPGGQTHTYRWRLWAVNTANLGVNASASFSALEAAAEAAKIEMLAFTGVSNAGGGK